MANKGNSLIASLTQTIDLPQVRVYRDPADIPCLVLCGRGRVSAHPATTGSELWVEHRQTDVSGNNDGAPQDTCAVPAVRVSSL